MKEMEYEGLQRSPELYIDRMGRLTNSRLSDAIRKTSKGNYYAARDTYMAQLIAERISNKPMPSYTSWAMQWGIDNEKLASDSYTALTGNPVVAVGFVKHPTIKWYGGSPDGLVGDDGSIEIKCPETAKHLNTILTGEVDEEYLDQMMGNMIVTGRKWCDFVSFDPRIEGEMSIFVKRIGYDVVRAKEIEREAVIFINEMIDKIDRMLVNYPRTREEYFKHWHSQYQ